MKRDKRAKTSTLKMKSSKLCHSSGRQSQSISCVSSLCGDVMKIPLTHGSDDILKSDWPNGYPFSLQCCLQLAQLTYYSIDYNFF